MPADAMVLVATAVLATVAVVAACVAVLVSRRATRTLRELRDETRPAPTEPERRTDQASAPVAPDPVGVLAVRPASQRREPELAPRIVEGRVIVPPTQEQVVRTAMTRPQTRIAIVASGVAHALRPESRDRIAGIVRREYRGRRRARLRAGRRAARAAHPTAPADQWLGET